MKRTPKNYDGSGLTTHQLREVAPAILRGINATVQERPDLVLKAWSVVVGSAVAKMTEAISFTSGVLLVRVKNSTLHSLLSQREKPRLLTALRRQLPNTAVYDIVFRMS
ncbi:MAG: DUF721 domain-containing protein [Chlamydiales bacterium]|nr:DUF721 domain-containing protein [Chlamydiales bacterium]